MFGNISPLIKISNSLSNFISLILVLQIGHSTLNLQCLNKQKY
uniref:Uncharacterized protein n=1 Tax=viral metagenome TaxID=1070528 RepID=A0A6C0LCU4_9ZZZZ